MGHIERTGGLDDDSGEELGRSGLLRILDLRQIPPANFGQAILVRMVGHYVRERLSLDPSKRRAVEKAVAMALSETEILARFREVDCIQGNVRDEVMTAWEEDPIPGHIAAQILTTLGIGSVHELVDEADFRSVLNRCLATESLPELKGPASGKFDRLPPGGEIKAA